MEIERVNIKKYKGVNNLMFTPKKLTAITGNIGTGKSSILEAIRFGLTGIADTPQKDAEVDMTVCGGKEIQWRLRSGNKSVKLERRVTTQEKVRQFLESTGVNMECMKVVTSAKLIVNMNAGSLCEFLVNSGLIPMSMTFDNMVKLCEIDPFIAKALTEYLPQNRAFSLAEVETAHKEVYDARTALNREIALITAQSQFEGEKPPRSVASIDMELAEILGAEERQRTYKVLMDKYEKDLQNQKRIRQEIQDVENKIRSMKVSRPDEEEKKRLQDESAALQRQMNDVMQSIVRLSHAINVQTKALDDLNNPVCPLSDKLECHTDKTMIRSEMEASVAELQDEKQSTEEKKTAIEERGKEIDTALSAWNQQMEEYLKLKSLYDTRKALQESMPIISAPPVAPDNITDLTAKKSALQMEKSRAEAYSRSLNAKRRLSDLQRKLGVLEKMLEVLSVKSGLREKIIASVLAPLEKHCNELADKLRLDFQLSIRVKNGVTILCKPKASMDFVNLTDVSTGEQTLAIFLILDMLNELSGFGILMMDNLDALDAASLDELMAVLTSPDVLSRYDHIFVSMVAHDDSVNVLGKYSGAIDEFIGMNDR